LPPDLVDQLEVIRVGSGRPAVVLHGPTPYASDLPFIRLLSRHVEVIAPSHPGFGSSPRPEEFDSVYDLVRLYLSFLETLGSRKVTLVGASFGGWLAAEIAVCAPPNLERLILVDSVGIKVGGRTERDILHLFNTPPAQLDRCSWHAPERRPPGPFGLGWQQHLDTLSDEDLVHLARAWDALCLYAWRPHLYNPHLAAWLHRIRVPTLLVWGASDGVVSPDYGRRYASRIPGARFEVIDEAGHHPELEQPEVFVKRVCEFLAE
jgi:pimeloyl-ACP methyl ester carboxylesterase